MTSINSFPFYMCPLSHQEMEFIPHPFESGPALLLLGNRTMIFLDSWVQPLRELEILLPSSYNTCSWNALSEPSYHAVRSPCHMQRSHGGEPSYSSSRCASESTTTLYDYSTPDNIIWDRETFHLSHQLTELWEITKLLFKPLSFGVLFYDYCANSRPKP